MPDEQAQTPTPCHHPLVTARDVVLAKRTFWQQYVGLGSGWFDPENPDAAGHLFDNLAEEGAFTAEWIVGKAQVAEKESF